MRSYAYYNGSFGRKEKITVPLSDRSIFFGDAVYEAAIGCYDRIMWEEEHIDRLLKNAERLGIEHGYDRQILSSILREVAIKSLIKSYLIYFQISRASVRRKHSATGCSANLLITIEPLKIERALAPMKLITFPDLRYGYCDIKTVNLLPAVLASTEAERQGCDEAVFVRNGIVTECAKSNIAIIKQGRVITHPTNNNILPGIVRSHLLQSCEELGVPYEERPFTKEELFLADEVLVTSTTKLCRTVKEIDKLAVGGKNPHIAHTLCDKLFTNYANCQTCE